MCEEGMVGRKSHSIVQQRAREYIENIGEIERTSTGGCVSVYECA